MEPKRGGCHIQISVDQFKVSSPAGSWKNLSTVISYAAMLGLVMDGI